MHKLAGLDAGFLYNETARAPQHIASVQVLELPEGQDIDGFISDFKALLVERAHLVPYFTRRLRYVPFNLDHPVWQHDAAFDIDNHVRQVEVAAPGGQAELEATIARLHESPLDRSRPLWEICVLTGLEGGRIAYYNRVHHACLDGVSGQAALQAIMDVSPKPRKVAPAPAVTEEASNSTGLLGDALQNLARFQSRQVARLGSQLQTFERLWQRGMDPNRGFGALGAQAPRTRLNRFIGRRRSYAAGDLSLTEMKAVGRATGTTLNDVFLAVCAGALRSYLQRRGELPRRPLIAGCPVSLRQPGDTSTNNQVTMMMVDMATGEADPLKRLLKVGHSAVQAKGVVADIAGSYDTDAALPGLPGMLEVGARWAEALRLAESPLMPLPCNLVVSNVPGPREQLYSLGARVLTHYPVSIPVHGQGANITVQSYMDRMYFGITACARALPDAAALRDDMLKAFSELKRVALRVPVAVKPPPRRTAAALPAANREVEAA